MDTGLSRWIVEDTEYEFAVGASSRDIRVRMTAPVRSERVSRPLIADSVLSEWIQHPAAASVVES